MVGLRCVCQRFVDSTISMATFSGEDLKESPRIRTCIFAMVLESRLSADTFGDLSANLRAFESLSPTSTVNFSSGVFRCIDHTGFSLAQKVVSISIGTLARRSCNLTNSKRSLVCCSRDVCTFSRDFLIITPTKCVSQVQSLLRLHL